jgi:hypothetical protein
MQDQLTRELARLAALSRLEYERERNDAAKHLRVRVRELDLEVEKLRSRHQAKRPAAKEPPTWAPPEKLWTAPVAGAELLGELIDAIRRFVILDQTSALVAALWVLFTWVFEHVAETNPFLRIISPAPECGKSTLLKVLKRLARSGWIVSRITASAFTRSIGAERRTLLLDEGDAFLHENEVMRNVLDGASDPDTANISLSVKSGDEWKPAEFNVFVPIAIASIRVLPKMQTVEDRSIAINLKRATRAELKQLAKGRRRELEAVLGPLAEKCARWAADSAEKLKGARPQMPEVLSGRDQDKWEPLIAIADAIGVEAGKDARVAAITVSNARDVGSVSLGEELLADIRAIFDEKATDKLSSRAICEALAAIEGRPWAEYGKAREACHSEPARTAAQAFCDRTPHDPAGKRIDPEGLRAEGLRRRLGALLGRRRSHI